MTPYLILAAGVVCGSLSVLVYKHAAVTHCRRLPILLAERSTILVLYLLLAIGGTGYVRDGRLLWLSLVAGTAVIGGRWTLLLAMRLGPAGLSWTIVNLSISLPIVVSIAFCGEWPTATQTVGLLLVPVGIALMRLAPGATAGDRPSGRWLLCMIACFCFEGCFGTCFRLLSELQLAPSRYLFILCFNAVALTGVTTVLVATRRLPRRQEVRCGLLSGMCFGLSGIFWVEAIIRLPGLIFFPFASILGIVCTLVLMRVIWRERLHWTQLVGVALGLAAIALIAR